MRIARGVLEFEFFDDSGFASARARAVAIGADDVHFDFAGSVAAEHGAILHEYDLRAVTRRRERGTDAGQAAADHDEVGN